MLFIEIILNERWKDLKYPGIKEGLYEISDFGRVYSHLKNRIIKPADHCQGYKHITLIGIDDRYKKILLHRIVAWHFVDGYSDEKRFPNHKDGIKINNYYKNLEWCTHRENTQHAIDTGLNPCKNLFKIKYKGSGNPNFKYPDNVVVRMCELLQSKIRSSRVADIILSEFPDKKYKHKSLHKYIQSKIKARLQRTEISSKYDF